LQTYGNLPSTTNMKLLTISIALILYFHIAQKDEAGKSVLIKEINYVDGVYYHEDMAFNGDIIDYHKNATLKFRYAVLDGRLHGIAKEFYATGQLKSEKHYVISKLYGKFTEYFETGQVRAEFDVKLNAYGQGELIESLKIGEIKKGRYKTQSYDQGIIYFISNQGVSLSNSEELSILHQSNYRITDRKKKRMLIEIL
jgi:antitoxin component YwqK of YwqJK toxin-antitoxin module